MDALNHAHPDCGGAPLGREVVGEEGVGGRRAPRLADADRRKDEFIAILSHELRNPLAPIRYALPLLRRDEFDVLEIQLLPGQEWLRCGDVIFLRGGQEVFRLPGVPRPQTFRELCLKQRNTLLAVREVLRQQSAASV